MSLASTPDSWDDPLPASQSKRPSAPAQAVPDDWDDDDDEEEDPQKLWETANSKAPMPQLIIGSSSTTTVVPPPPAAFQPTLRILKRPSASPGSSTPNTSAATEAQRSYADREAQYQAARERIFREGTKSPPGSDAGAKSPPLSGDSGSSTPVRIIRNPKGPGTPPSGDASSVAPGDGGAAIGFGSRRNAKTRSPRTNSTSEGP